MLWRTVKEYCANSTIHGLQFITQDGRHSMERLFWITSCALSWYGSWLLIVASYEAAQQSPISFVVDTTHIHWNTAFPAISVCETDNMQRVYDAADILFTPDHDFNLDEVLKEIAYFRGTAAFTAEYCFDGTMECPTSNLSSYAKTAIPILDCFIIRLVVKKNPLWTHTIEVAPQGTENCYFHKNIRAPCKELFHSCSWNDEEFDCCSRFLPLETEFGLCFSVNSIQTRKMNGSIPNTMISNINTGPGNLKFKLTAPVEVHWHSHADVPYFNKLSSEAMMVQPGSLKRRSLAIRETVNEEAVRDVSSESRRCRYAEENILTVYQYYSYSACVVECRYQSSLELCNCSSHMIPSVGSEARPICDLRGLNCLNTNYDKLAVRKSSDGGGCKCVPECDEPEIAIVVDENIRDDEPLSKVEIILDRLPVDRFQRIVVRSNLDLVVSMGGTAGLFIGASLLSVVELIYFFTVRLCCALRHQHVIRMRNKIKKHRHHFVTWATKTRKIRHSKQIYE